MATGAGKTLVMAAIVLFLYQQGYRYFLFLVHQIQILNQACKNFTDYKFDKYLFNPKGIKIDGKAVSIIDTKNIDQANHNSIHFLFFSTQALYSRLREDRENELTAQSFKEKKVVIIADEAHRLNVDTRSKKKTEQEEANNWESVVMGAVHAHQENKLLEFTATVDLAHLAIREKYQDKIIYRYDFLAFNKAGYSKEVKFLYNPETHIEDQKRLLIVNAVALSEYRRLFAEREMGFSIQPVVLIKSSSISQSEADRAFFDQVISSLQPQDLKHLQTLAQGNQGGEHRIITQMFAWLENKQNGLISAGDWNGLNRFTSEIRHRFAHDHTLIYNSQKKENPEQLLRLDSDRNTIRAIFSVNALNEGWDVLSLYDIVHFDISDSKQVSLQDIQLIGRGARYYPFELPKTYLKNKGGILQGSNRLFAQSKFQRKFDNNPHDRGRILETLFYHFVKTGIFLENLQKELLGEGIIHEGVEEKTIHLKDSFKQSNTYQKGFVLVNRAVQRTKTQDSEIDTTFKQVIKAGAYRLKSAGLSDYAQNQIIAETRQTKISITEEYFSLPIIRTALISAEGNFFRISNLKKHIIGIETIDTLIYQYLPLYEIQYSYEKGKEIENLNPREKLQLLRGMILPEIRKAIDLNMPQVIGSKVFRPVPLSHIFSQEKSIYLTSFPTEDPITGEKIYISSDERAKAQSDHENPELQYEISKADWYAYSENYGTSEEKRFVKYVAGQINGLRDKFAGAEIYLIRNELDYWLFNPQDGRRFSPDYLLFINDVLNETFYYQCFIEPKGGHLLEHDAWKEQALISLNEGSKVIFDSEPEDRENYRAYLAEIKQRGYQEIKPIGLKFYNSAPRGEEDFALDFQEKL
ncbi:hypothetical protein NURINAE_01037 [Candidatus Nitrosacidococcus sp. I8]|nr:hypothetical protein NURINAE_01037 [Candidatus Nitrosacidococcus sp. I8]